MPRILTIALAAIFACVNLALPVAAGGEFIHPAQVADLCKYANDGECDEPHKCALGTDGDDCAQTQGGQSENNDPLAGLRGTPPPTNTQTEIALKICGAWNGQLNPNAVVNIEDNDAILHVTSKCGAYHQSGHLHVAARLNDLTSARWLLANGGDVNAKARKDDAPLHLAAHNNAREMAELLLRNNANVNAKNIGEQTPLHDAAFGNASEIAEMLIKNGADVHAKNIFDETPLHVAAENNAPEIAEMLIKSGADVHAKNIIGATPLHDAAFGNAPKIAEMLIKSGVDVNAKDENGETPMDFAIHENNAEMQSFLRQHGGRCNKEC